MTVTPSSATVSTRFARRVFSLAGTYGVLTLAPQYFLAERVGRDTPPPLTHLEYFYGFVGIALAWQVAFLIIGRDPVRYRPLMIAAVLEKLTFGVPAIVLYAQHQLPPTVLGFGLIDLTLGGLFAMSYQRTRIE
ncbi:MAG: hypothetical protein ABI625_00265 [bacterium]